MSIEDEDDDDEYEDDLQNRRLPTMVVACDGACLANLNNLIVDPLFRQVKILDHRTAGVGVNQVIITVAGLDQGWIGDTDIGAIP